MVSIYLEAGGEVGLAGTAFVAGDGAVSGGAVGRAGIEIVIGIGSTLIGGVFPYPYRPFIIGGIPGYISRMVGAGVMNVVSPFSKSSGCSALIAARRSPTILLGRKASGFFNAFS